MKIALITQNEHFFLPRTIEELITKLTINHEIVGAVALSASPFGGKHSFVTKCMKTYQIFGIKFFIYYSVIFLINKIRRKTVVDVIKNKEVKLLDISGSINSEASIQKIKDTGAELLISIAGNQIFKEKLFNEFQFGCINLHTALLPEYRGLMPTFWAMKNNERYAGVSVFQVDKGIDSGPIIAQDKVSTEGLSHKDLIIVSKKLGVKLIIRAVELIDIGELEYIENLNIDATYFGFPTKSDVKDFLKKGNKFI